MASPEYRAQVTAGKTSWAADLRRAARTAKSWDEYLEWVNASPVSYDSRFVEATWLVWKSVGG